MELTHRYDRNMIFTADEQQMLGGLSVAVVGLGGLGGFVAEELARLGVGKLVIFDGDVFDETNLNRQLFATEKTIGKSKAKTAAKRLAQVNSEIEIKVYDKFLTSKKLKNAVAGCNVIVDCLDSAKNKLALMDIARECGAPMVHGAISDWVGQVVTVFPGDDSLEIVYPRGEEPPLTGGNAVFTAAAIASIQVAETVKILIGRGNLLRKKMMIVDTFHGEFMVVDVK